MWAHTCFKRSLKSERLSNLPVVAIMEIKQTHGSWYIDIFIDSIALSYEKSRSIRSDERAVGNRHGLT